MKCNFPAPLCAVLQPAEIRLLLLFGAQIDSQLIMTIITDSAVFSKWSTGGPITPTVPVASEIICSDLATVIHSFIYTNSSTSSICPFLYNSSFRGCTGSLPSINTQTHWPLQIHQNQDTPTSYQINPYQDILLTPTSAQTPGHADHSKYTNTRTQWPPLNTRLPVHTNPSKYTNTRTHTLPSTQCSTLKFRLGCYQI